MIISSFNIICNVSVLNCVVVVGGDGVEVL